MHNPPSRGLLSGLILVVLLAGLALRMVGFARGGSDLVHPEDRLRGQEFSFYTFHPDENYLVNSALREIDLLHPPYTSYGTMPAYALGVALRLVGARGDGGSVDGATPEFRQAVYYVARALAVVYSFGVLLLTWGLGRRLLGDVPALVATAIVALAPGAVQQAHFYIVDGAFALTSLAALWAIMRCLRDPDTGLAPFLAAGALIGLTASVRFNGAVLGLVLAGGLLLSTPGTPRQRLAIVLPHRGLWYAGGVAIAILLAFHPFIVTDPGLLTRDTRVGDIALAMKFARGDVLQPWTLVDAHVIPYVSHWFGMWPLIVGWPLTLLLLVGLVWGLWRGGWQVRLLAVWCLLYFLPIGALPARAVRHLVPILAPLALVTAAAGLDAWRATVEPRRRQALAITAGLLGVHLFLYGTAFAHIYQVEDSRIRAGRFLLNRVREGTRIGLESGAFTVAGQVSDSYFRRRWMDTSRLLYSGPYMTCGKRVDYLHERMERIEGLVFTDVNRAVQYAAVPRLFPVAADYYGRLLAGELGMKVVRRFKTYPRVAGITFEDDGGDPTFLGYDHPATYILLRPNESDMPGAFTRWREKLTSSAACPDDGLRRAAGHLREGRARAALDELDALVASHPNALLAYRLQAEAHHVLGDTSGARAALRQYDPKTAGGRMAHVYNPNMIHFVAPSAGRSLIELGLYDLALRVLHEGLAEEYPKVLRFIVPRAHAYFRAAADFEAAGQLQHRETAVRMSLQVHRTARASNALARIIRFGNGLEEARGLYEQSLLLDASQARIHLELAQVLAELGEDEETVLHHLERAVALDAELAPAARALTTLLRDAAGGP